MFSGVGRATTNLHPQLQRDTSLDKLKALRNREAVTERAKPSRREVDEKKEDYFFYNILDYNKEAAAKLREVSYVPRVGVELTALDRRTSCRQVQTQV
jgi:hypothetical protein